MIMPRSKLLLWFAIVMLPFSILGAVEPAAGAVSILAIGAFFALILIDAIRAPASLKGISLLLPEVTRMSKEREAKLELRVRNELQAPRILRVGLALPAEIQSPEEDAHVALPQGAEWSRFTWRVLPVKRGNFYLETAYLEGGSPFGFWSQRKVLPIHSEIRVYPNLFAERRSLAALFLHRGSFGTHAQRQIGRGRDFEKLRDYIPGDSYDEVHWKATAKRGRPITKVFQIERTQEVYVIIDASRLSARPAAVANANIQSHVPPFPPHPGPLPLGGPLGGGEGGCPSAPGLRLGLPLPRRGGEGGVRGKNPTPKTLQPATTLERFVTAALVLGLAAEQQGDLFGLLTFSNKVETFVRAKNGKAHYSACRDALYTLQPQAVTPDYDELCSFIRLRLRRRGLLVFLTSLDDPVLAASFVRNMDLIRRQHLVIVNMLQPPGIAPVFTHPNIGSMDELYQHLGGHLLWQNLRELEKVLKRRGVRFSLLKNERLSAELVSQYLSVKQRQIL
jgi:uncharacterized protein (DUF58 family)